MGTAGEDKARARKPDAAGVDTAAAEPQTGSAPPHKEQPKSATRARNRIHGDDKLLFFRLIFILQPQLRSDFGRAQIQPKLIGPTVDSRTSSPIFEAKLVNRFDHQINLDFLDSHCESGIAENAIGLATDFVSAVPEGLAEVIGCLKASAKIDSLEGLEIDLRTSQFGRAYSYDCTHRFLLYLNSTNFFRLTVTLAVIARKYRIIYFSSIKSVSFGYDCYSQVSLYIKELSSFSML